MIRRRYRLILAGMFLALAAAGFFSFAIGYSLDPSGSVSGLPLPLRFR